jgi:hypothetical protein
MQLSELPGFSNAFSEFFAGRPGPGSVLVPCRSTDRIRELTDARPKPASSIRADLAQLAGQHSAGLSILSHSTLQEQLAKLKLPESILVAVYHDNDPWGGTLAQVLKVLTALKIAAAFETSGVAAVPLCCIGRRWSPRPDAGLMRLLDGDSGILEIRLREHGPGEEFPGIALDQIIEGLGRTLTPDSLDWILSTVSGADAKSRADRAAAAAFESLPILFLDTRSVDFESWMERTRSCSDLAGEPSLPEADGADDYSRIASRFETAACVSAVVMDEFELAGREGVQIAFQKSGIPSPALWPRASATLIDSRSRRTLDRYTIGLSSLFEGTEAVLQYLSEGDRSRSAVATLTGLADKSALELRGIQAGFGGEDKMGSVLADAERKILYQLNKLKERAESAGKVKYDAMARHVDRACAALAPRGLPQESGLSALHFFLRYSTSVLRKVSEGLNERSNEHQLVSVE